MLRYLFMRYGFLLSVTVAWFTFLLLPYLLVLSLAPSKVVDWGWTGRWHILDVPFMLLALACAFIGAGLYYVVGRKILLALGLFDDEVAEYSFKQFRYYRRGYRVTPRLRGRRRSKE